MLCGQIEVLDLNPLSGSAGHFRWIGIDSVAKLEPSGHTDHLHYQLQQKRKFLGNRTLLVSHYF